MAVWVHNKGENATPYSARQWRSHLEGKYGVDNVSSTTIAPNVNRWNLRLAGQRHSTGTVADNRGFPIFDDVVAADLKISAAGVSGRNYSGQMREATRALRSMINEGTYNTSKFNSLQLRQIQSGLDKIKGFTWHHHQDVGRMQLVPTTTHGKYQHIGGFEMWYGK